MSYTDEQRLEYDFFAGDEADITCRTVKIRRAKKEHTCFGLTGRQDHTIKPGERYRHEKALIDGDFWGQYRLCLHCIDKQLAEIHGEEDDETETAPPEDQKS